MNNPDKELLSLLLLESDIDQSAEAIIDLIKGVSAGPPPEGSMGDSNAWLELISPDMTDALVKLLKAELAR